LRDETDSIERLSDEVGADVAAMIEAGMIRHSVEYIRTYPIYHRNPSPSVWRGLIRIGRVLGEPDYIHDAVEQARECMETRWFGDGFWCEVTVNYHLTTFRKVIDTVQHAAGWTDPPGYVSPRSGRRFDRLDLTREFPPYYHLALRVADI